MQMSGLILVVYNRMAYTTTANASMNHLLSATFWSGIHISFPCELSLGERRLLPKFEDKERHTLYNIEMLIVYPNAAL